MRCVKRLRDWDRYIHEITYTRPFKIQHPAFERQMFESSCFSSWRDFFKTTFEGSVFEDAFRDHFIAKMLAQNFTYIRKETQLFDIVAYRTVKDSEGMTPFYIWSYYEENPNHPIVLNYLKNHNLTKLEPPHPFPGKRMLYGFEIKTDSDNVYHFLDQLPRYAWMFDAVVLVIGEKQVPPKRLPSWVEVWQRRGDEYVRLRHSSHRYTFLGGTAFDPAKWYMPHKKGDYLNFDYSGSSSFSEFIRFLRRCAISALFKNEEVEPYTRFDRAIYDALRFWVRHSGNVVEMDDAGVPRERIETFDELIEKEVERRINKRIEDEVDRRLSQRGTVVKAPAPGEKMLNRLVPRSLTDFAGEKNI